VRPRNASSRFDPGVCAYVRPRAAFGFVLVLCQEVNDRLPCPPLIILFSFISVGGRLPSERRLCNPLGVDLGYQTVVICQPVPV
jgi:hypothetical protein